MKKVLVIYMGSAKNDVVVHVKNILKKYNIKFIAKERNKRKRTNFKKDLIIVIGGDGTFLRTAHFVKDKTPLFGVNSDPKKKEGFFMCCNKNTFEKKFKNFLAGKLKIDYLTRLETRINGKKLVPCLNEVYIGPKKPYNVGFYNLKIGKKSELQKSSGILVGTPCGSNAWLKSAGANRLPKGSKKFQYIVREPYSGKLHKEKMVKGILNNNQTVEVTSQMNDGIIVVDSLSGEYSFKKGKKVKIKISNKLLRVVF